MLAKVCASWLRGYLLFCASCALAATWGILAAMYRTLVNDDRD